MNEAASRSFAASVVALASVRLLGVGAGFVVGVIGARALGQSGFGAAGVAIAVATLAALACNGGVNIATVYLAGRDERGRRAVFRSTAAIAGGGALAAVLVVIAAGVVLGELLELGGRGDLFAAAAAVAAGVIGFEYGGAVLLALALPRAYAAVDLGRSLSALALTAALVALTATDAAFVLAAGLAYLGSAVAALLVAHQSSGELGIGWDPALVRASLSIGLRGQAGNVLQFLNLRVDLLLIPALLSLSAAGLYLVAVRAAEVLTQVANAAGSLIFPAVVAHEDSASTALTERTVRITLLVVAAAAVVLVALADPLVRLAFGAEYGGAVTTLRLLAAAMLPLSVTRILAGDLKGRGRPGVVSLAMLAAVAATLLGDLLLIPILGIEGAAIASLIAYSISAAVLLAAFRSATGARLEVLVPRPADAIELLRPGRSGRRAAP